MEARLQLASLYAATDVQGVPEPRAGVTGAERAIELLRGCFVNRPLSTAEAAHLSRVFGFALHAPALRLLCASLEDSASQLAFLHPGRASLPLPPDGPPDAAAASGRMDDLADAITEYGLAVQRGACSAASTLTPAEETLALGCRTARPQPARLLHVSAASAAHLPPPPVSRAWVADAEAQLAALTEEVAPPKLAPAFPLPSVAVSGGDALVADMRAELCDSWAAHVQQPSWRLRGALLLPVQAAFAVSARRAAAEAWCLAAHAAEPPPGSATSWRAAGLRLHRAAGAAPLPRGADLARALCELPSAAGALCGLADSIASTSVADTAIVHDGVLAWLELCVLEDRLRRLERMALAGD